MATLFVASSGSNTAPYDTWAKAATSFQTALTAANADGDIVVVKYNGVPSGDAELSADTVYTTVQNISIISASADDSGTAYTPTVMGTSNWIGNSTTNRRVGINPGADDRVYVYGITFRTAGTVGDFLGLNYVSAGSDCTFEDCYFWHGNTDGGSHIQIGTGNAQNVFNEFKGCTFRFGAAAQTLLLAGSIIFIDCSFASVGTVPTSGLVYPNGGTERVEFIGCDLSALGSNTIVPNIPQTFTALFDRCKIGAGATILASQTSNPTRSSAEVFLHDCSSGDTHGIFGYYNALGSVVTDTGIYFTSGAAGQSWKIVTTANASKRGPFCTPMIDLYWDGTSAITPYVEALRDGSATAYTDAEVWVEILAKRTSGSTKASTANDRQSLSDYCKTTAGTAQADGAGLGSWTGESGTAKSMKLALGTSITPAEVGSLTARIYVAAPSITVYIDPQIRT